MVLKSWKLIMSCFYPLGFIHGQICMCLIVNSNEPDYSASLRQWMVSGLELCCKRCQFDETQFADSQNAESSLPIPRMPSPVCWFPECLVQFADSQNAKSSLPIPRMPSPVYRFPECRVQFADSQNAKSSLPKPSLPNFYFFCQLIIFGGKKHVGGRVIVYSVIYTHTLI